MSIPSINNTYRVVVSVFLAWLFFISASCNNDYHIRLSKDYTLVRINSDDISIFLDTRTINVKIYIRDKTEPEKGVGDIPVPTKIVSHGQEGDIVFGEIKKVTNLHGRNNHENYSEDVSGFFILDMNEHKCILGLDRATLDKKLAEHGIHNAKMQRTKWQ